MFQVLNVQQYTKFDIEKQLQHAHDTQSDQVWALEELTHVNNQRSFDQVFVAIHLIDGEYPTKLDNRIEALDNGMLSKQ